MVSLWVSMLNVIPYVLFKFLVVIHDAHIIQLDRSNYNAPNLNKILSNEKLQKYFTMVELIWLILNII